MPSSKGVMPAVKKDGTPYYRASITYKNKHISLGSFSTENAAAASYALARHILFDAGTRLEDFPQPCPLSFEKWVILHNFRDNGYYFNTPIYMHKYYFSYHIDRKSELTFDVDDLFYYARHKILRRNGYLFVNDFGLQTNILSRYGIKNFAVCGRDYRFIDGNSNNMRYHNIEVINPYCGVQRHIENGRTTYVARIHVNGDWLIGRFDMLEHAAVAYNKAADYLNRFHLPAKQFARNYIEHFSQDTYRTVYEEIRLPKKFLEDSPLFSNKKIEAAGY